MPVPSQEYNSCCPFVLCVLSLDFAIWLGTFRFEFSSEFSIFVILLFSYIILKECKKFRFWIMSGPMYWLLNWTAWWYYQVIPVHQQWYRSSSRKSNNKFGTSEDLRQWWAITIHLRSVLLLIYFIHAIASLIRRKLQPQHYKLCNLLYPMVLFRYSILLVYRIKTFCKISIHNIISLILYYDDC